MNTNSDDFNGALSPLRVYPDEMPNRGEDHDIGRRDHSLIAREVLAMPPQGAEKDVVGMQQMHRTSLVTAWVSSLISFSVLASAKHKNFDYSDSTALGFTVGAGVIIWLSISALLTFPFAHSSKAFAALHAVSAVLAYSAAVASASISADLMVDDTFDDNRLASNLKSYNSRVRAGCTFIWFTAVATIIASLVLAHAAACNWDTHRAEQLLRDEKSSRGGTHSPFFQGNIFTAIPSSTSPPPYPQPPPPPPPQEAPSSANL